MRAGLFNRPVKIYEPWIYTDASTGEQYNTARWVMDTKARLMPSRTNRDVVNDEMTYTQTIDIAVRSYVPIKEYSQIKMDSVTYNVIGILKDTANNCIIVTCTKDTTV